MKILIIEDEEPAANRLQSMIKEVDNETQVLDVIVSIKTAVQWFKNNKAPDLVFLDIQLADGISFEIFKQVEVKSPIIFTTAFDEYAIEAFKVNSVDYLLKPLKKEELSKAMLKFKSLHGTTNVPVDLEELLRTIHNPEQKYKSRFLIRFADQIKKIEVSDIAYFYTQDKINYLKIFSGNSYPIDLNLDSVEKAIDPQKYFRINRQFIVNIESIEQMFAFSKSRVKLKLKPATDIETIVSTDRSPHFKAWLGDDLE
ncbi:MAG TPA: LytTR family DNA-binding domain-containing protein [Bacteroidia bacterium]|nr:LytTR family DNA-binding domain-containing protein [Bacteroidia bacterium]